jgi:DNA-binding XRE family transcriptional regulator
MKSPKPDQTLAQVFMAEPMTATEYKATRKRLGMTQAALAAALGVSRKAINEREAGGTITREAAMALELLALRSPKKSRKSENSRDQQREWPC